MKVQNRNPVGSTKSSSLTQLSSLASLSLSLSLLSLTRIGLELMRECLYRGLGRSLGGLGLFKASWWPKGATQPLNRLIFFSFSAEVRSTGPCTSSRPEDQNPQFRIFGQLGLTNVIFPLLMFQINLLIFQNILFLNNNL